MSCEFNSASSTWWVSLGEFHMSDTTSSTSCEFCHRFVSRNNVKIEFESHCVAVLIQALLHCNIKFFYTAISSSSTLQYQVLLHCNIKFFYTAISSSSTLQYQVLLHCNIKFFYYFKIVFLYIRNQVKEVYWILKFTFQQNSSNDIRRFVSYNICYEHMVNFKLSINLRSQFRLLFHFDTLFELVGVLCESPRLRSLSCITESIKTIITYLTTSDKYNVFFLFAR